MDCGACGSANREGARFCAQCGAPLALRCSGCQAELAAAARFCDQCGTPVAPPGDAAPVDVVGAPGEAVRKVVSVLFADLGGSTGFGERVDAETARTVMARYHVLLAEVIEAHQGTVAKFIGDGAMALFGVPEVGEDDAARAVRAGAELQDRFAAFAAGVREAHGEVLTLRVGINTGEVVVGEGDADLVGDAINVAARLEAAAPSGGVLVGPETWRLTRSSVAYDPVGALAVKGRAEPVHAHRLAPTPASPVEAEAPFVGRDRELARLGGALDDVVATGSARLATVIGSPGVGKTRLVRQLLAVAGGRAVTYELRCDRAGEATFAPVVELLRRAAGLDDDMDADAVRQRVAAMVGDGVADGERIVDGLVGVVGVGAARSTEETFWAVRRLLEVVAAERPVLVAIDDVQWAEPLLLDLLEHLAEWVDGPLLLVAMARPELRDLRPSLAEAGRRVAEVVALDGLDATSTAELAARLLGAERLPDELVERLPTSTDGNPLFVRELVRMLVDDQVIERHGDRWALTIDAEAVDVPPTIQSLLAARVERLAGDERLVLERAAVIGAEFSLGALGALLDGRPDAARQLEGLRRRELVEPTGGYWGDDPVFRFHHVLIRDAAYRRLLKTTRAELHERAARWTDEAAPRAIGEHEAAIAHHYEQAHAYRTQVGLDDERTRDVGDRAAELLTTAAHRALDRDDLTAAGTLAGRALACLAPTAGAERAELAVLACEALLAAGSVAAAEPHLATLRDLADGDRRLAAWVACFDAQRTSLTDPDGLQDAERTARRAAEELTDLGDRAGEAKAHLVLAGVLARFGRIADCEAELDRALGAARAVDDRRRVIAVLGVAPVAALWGPSPVTRAGGRCLDVIRLLRITSASPAVEATSVRCQGVLEALRGRTDTARSMLARARAMVEDLGAQRELCETDLLAGVVELLAGDPGAAEAPLRRAHAGLGSLGVGADAGQAAALLARALLAQGRGDEADELATASEAMAGQNLKTAIAWRGARAALLSVAGDHGRSEALAAEAVAIAAGTDLLVDHAQACATLAEVRAAAGDVEGAAAALAEADRLHREKGATALVADGGSADDPPGPEAPSFRHTPMTRTIERFWRRAAAGDAAGVRALLADDYVSVDERSGLQSRVEGADAMVRSLGDLAKAPTPVLRTVELLGSYGDRLALVRQRVLDRDVPEWDLLTMVEVDEEGLQRASWAFDVADRERALAQLAARAAALAAADGVALDGSDPVSRCYERFWAAIEQEDWTALRALLAPDFVLDERRAGLRATIAGPDVEIDHLRFMREGGVGDGVGPWPSGGVSTREVLAVHGDRLALFRQHVGGPTRGSAGPTWDLLSIVELDEHGRYRRGVSFDPDDEAAAWAELDARRLALKGGVGSPADAGPTLPAVGSAVPSGGDDGGEREAGQPNEAVAVARALTPLVAEGAVDAAGELVALDYRYDDRRPGLAVVVEGRADNVVAFRHLHEVLGGAAIDLEVVAERGRRTALLRAWTTGSIRTEWLMVVEVDQDGLATASTSFAPDDVASALAHLDERGRVGEDELAEARARQHELAAGDVAAPENLATGNLRGWSVQVTAGDLDGMMARMAPDLLWLDRRAGMQARYDGPEAQADSWRAAFEISPPFANRVAEVLAERGDRLTLVRCEVVDRDGSPEPSGLKVGYLALQEVSADGLATYGATFDVDDLEGAMAELEERYVAGEGAPNAEHVALVHRYRDAFNGRDGEALAGCLAEGFVGVNRRPLSFDEADRTSWVERTRQWHELVPDVVLHHRRMSFVGDVALVTTEFVGTTPDGAPQRWVLHSVSVQRAGRVERMEIFGEDDLGGAQARQRELAEGGDGVLGAVLPSAGAGLVERRRARFLEGWVQGDLEAMEAAFDPDCRFENHQSGPSASFVRSRPAEMGRRQFCEAMLGLAAAGFGPPEATPVARLGARVEVVRMRTATDGGFETVALLVEEVGDQGALVRVALFDDGDLAAAADLAQRWYVQGEGAGAAAAHDASRRATASYNAHDVEAFTDVLAEDVVLVSELALLPPSTGRAAFVDRTVRTWELLPDAVLFPVAVHADHPRAVLTTVVRHATTDDGAPLEWRWLSLTTFADGRLQRMEQFEEADLDRALARFAALTGGSQQ